MNEGSEQWKARERELVQLQALPLEIKVAKTKLRIREFVQHYGLKNVYVAFSGGKDSTVLLHIAREEYPEMRAIFTNTTCEFPEIVKFVKSVPNVDIAMPDVNMKWVIEKYGYPVISKQQALFIWEMRNYNVSEEWRAWRLNPEKSFFTISKKWQKLFLDNPDAPKISDKCCYYLKKKPAEKLCKKLAGGGKMFRIVGTMADESRIRRQTWLKHGCNTFDDKKGRSAPMSFWTEQDVLEYLDTYQIPYCSVYGKIKKDANGKYYTTGEERTGCMGCGFGLHLQEYPNDYQRLQKKYPKIWDYYVNKLGFGKVFDFCGIKYRCDDLGLLDGEEK